MFIGLKMKLVLFLACLSACTLVSYGVPSSSRRSNRRYGYTGLTKQQILAPTDNAAAAMGGVRIPPASCVMTWNEFETMVVGKTWLGVYSIDDDFTLNPEKAYKFIGLWTLNGTNVRRQGTLWNDLTKQCLVADGQFSRASSSQAILGSIGGNLFATADRKDYFISCDPSRYFIFYICYVAPVSGRCPLSEIFLMVPDQRPLSPEGDLKREGDLLLNDIPWTKVEYEFKRCLDQLFVDDMDPQLEWVWQNTECPHPNSEAAKM